MSTAYTINNCGFHMEAELASRKTKAPAVDYNEAAKNILRAEMKRRGLSYADLAKKLTESGEPSEEKIINNKVARGTFSAAFLIQCLNVIGAKAVQIAD